MQSERVMTQTETRAGTEEIAARRADAVRRSGTLVERLRNPRRYPHPAGAVELLETHISWVLLTGRFAYKIKKPLDLGFLDFASLAARRRACDEELRLNRRTAPDLYLEVVPIIGTEEEPVVGGVGTAIEYAVKMHEFPQDALADRLAARGELSVDRMDELAATIAAFHARVERAGPASEFGTPAEVIAPARQNFEQIRALLGGAGSGAALGPLATWTEREFARLCDVFETRQRGGFVRECHGDLHLRNLVQRDGRLVPFDCIEFNDRLRWIDVMSEVAFLVMDLADHGLAAHAWRLLNAYLEESGDYGGLVVLRFYLVYRAMVRAKIAALRAGQLPAGAPERAQAEQDCVDHLRLAEEFAAPDRRALVVTRGLSGSGKSAFAQRFVEELGAIRVRSDVERKRLHGLAARAQTGAAMHGGIYAPDATRRTYERLRESARAVLAAGFPVVVDATFLARADRDALRALAREAGVPFAIAACDAPEGVLRERILARGRAAAEASEATLEVLARQLATQEPLAPVERAFAVPVNTAQDVHALRRSAIALGERLGLSRLRPGATSGP